MGEKPPESPLTIPAEIHHAVMSMPPEARHDRAKVNEAVRQAMETSDEDPAQHRP
jgi:hypothetical protein